jgi:hypothetical protein
MKTARNTCLFPKKIIWIIQIIKGFGNLMITRVKLDDSHGYISPKKKMRFICESDFIFYSSPSQNFD